MRSCAYAEDYLICIRIVTLYLLDAEQHRSLPRTTRSANLSGHTHTGIYRATNTVPPCTSENKMEAENDRRTLHITIGLWAGW